MKGDSFLGAELGDWTIEAEMCGGEEHEAMAETRRVALSTQ